MGGVAGVGDHGRTAISRPSSRAARNSAAGDMLTVATPMSRSTRQLGRRLVLGPGQRRRGRRDQVAPAGSRERGAMPGSGSVAGSADRPSRPERRTGSRAPRSATTDPRRSLSARTPLRRSVSIRRPHPPGRQRAHRQLHLAQVEALVLVDPALQEGHRAVRIESPEQRREGAPAPLPLRQCGTSLIADASASATSLETAAEAGTQDNGHLRGGPEALPRASAAASAASSGPPGPGRRRPLPPGRGLRRRVASPAARRVAVGDDVSRQARGSRPVRRCVDGGPGVGEGALVDRVRGSLVAGGRAEAARTPGCGRCWASSDPPRGRR